MEPDAEQTNYTCTYKGAFNNEESVIIAATSTQACSPKKNAKSLVRQLRSQTYKKTASNIAKIKPVASTQQKKVPKRQTKTQNNIKKKATVTT